MAQLIHCTDRYAHVDLAIPRELWEELLDRHFTQGAALGTVRTSALNGIRARLVQIAIDELENRAHGEPCDSAELPDNRA